MTCLYIEGDKYGSKMLITYKQHWIPGEMYQMHGNEERFRAPMFDCQGEVTYLQMPLKSLDNTINFKGIRRPNFILDLYVSNSRIWLPTYDKTDNAYHF